MTSEAIIGDGQVPYKHLTVVYFSFTGANGEPLSCAAVARACSDSSASAHPCGAADIDGVRRMLSTRYMVLAIDELGGRPRTSQLG